MYIRNRALSALKMCMVFSFTSYVSLAMAISPESELPIEIESDSATFDDSKGTSSYSGNVVISQGFSRLEADSVTVSSVNRKIISIKANGRPAHFIQQASAEAPATHGYGNTIHYLAADAILRLENNASLVQQDNSFSGDLIEYDILKRAIKAKGDETIGTRVKIQYYPHVSDRQATKPEPEQTLEQKIESTETKNKTDAAPTLQPRPAKPSPIQQDSYTQ